MKFQKIKVQNIDHDESVSTKDEESTNCINFPNLKVHQSPKPLIIKTHLKTSLKSSFDQNSTCLLQHLLVLFTWWEVTIESRLTKKDSKYCLKLIFLLKSMKVSIYWTPILSQCINLILFKMRCYMMINIHFRTSICRKFEKRKRNERWMKFMVSVWMNANCLECPLMLRNLVDSFLRNKIWCFKRKMKRLNDFLFLRIWKLELTRFVFKIIFETTMKEFIETRSIWILP